MSKFLPYLLLAVTHPEELRAMINYKLWRDPLNDITKNPEAGFDRDEMKRCWEFLDMTSRSFSAVIKELQGELAKVVCLFYLVLRGLDTIEDDMTIPIERKVEELTHFWKRLDQSGWTFTESGPNEKDRQLLVEFDKVIAEMQRLPDGYRAIITDITAKMGGGMASYALASSQSPLAVDKVEDYDLYCHFVAGLVGEGLSRLFSQSGLERPEVGLQLQLSNHMGLFLQKTNIIRDYAEDVEQRRFFWPKEIYAQFGFESQEDMGKFIHPISESAAPEKRRYKAEESETGKAAMHVLSAMLLDAISHATESLDYLSMLKNQSVFNFCAIPQLMAIATLAELAANPDVYRRNVKIRKGKAVQLILKAVNPRDVAYSFLEYCRIIHAKVTADDPNFLRWSIVLGKIEYWCEEHFPSWITKEQDAGGSNDARKAGVLAMVEERRALAMGRPTPSALRLSAAGIAPLAGQADSAGAVAEAHPLSDEAKTKAAQEERYEMMKFFAIIGGSILGVCLLMAVALFFVVWFLTRDQTDGISMGGVDQLAQSIFNGAPAPSSRVHGEL